MDEDLDRLITVVRPMIKGHIKSTQNLLGYLTELDRKLAESQKEADRNAEDEIRAA